MKINFFNWEKYFLIKQMLNVNNYDFVYTDNLMEKNYTCFCSFMEIDINSQNFSDITQSCRILKKFCKNKPYVVFKQGRFGLIFSSIRVSVSSNFLHVFLYYLLSVVYPTMIAKQILFKFNFDTASQLRQTFNDVNVYLRLGVKYKIIEWNFPIKFNFKSINKFNSNVEYQFLMIGFNSFTKK
jgi:hypothetical protein